MFGGSDHGKVRVGWDRSLFRPQHGLVWPGLGTAAKLGGEAENEKHKLHKLHNSRIIFIDNYV